MDATCTPGLPTVVTTLVRLTSRPAAGPFSTLMAAGMVLAGAGLVEDTGLGNAKTRVWALPDDEEDGDDLTVRSLSPDPEDIEDDLWLAHDHVEHLAARAHTWVDAASAWPFVWQEESGLHDHAVLVDEEQLVALRTELGAVLDRYRRRGAGTPGARRVTAVVALTPLPRRT